MRNIWPMGCKKTPNADKVEQLLSDPTYIAQPKIDGVRCILHFDSDGIAHYTTRGSSRKDPEIPIEITHRLKHMQLVIPQFANSELDGELWLNNKTSAELSGQVNFRSNVFVDPNIKLRIFDSLKFLGNPLENRKLQDRLKILNSMSTFLSDYGIYEFVPVAYSEEEKRQLLSTELEEGREGIVLKNLNACYYFGRYDRDAKPSNNWYKVKKKDTIDVIITGSQPPEKYYKDPISGIIDFDRYTKPYINGWLGSIAFTFGNNSGFTSGLTDRMREQLSDGNHGIKKEYIGRIMEVEYMEKTSDGNLRHPRFVRIREEIEK